jgi:hypothetical protein
MFNSHDKSFRADCLQPQVEEFEPKVVDEALRGKEEGARRLTMLNHCPTLRWGLWRLTKSV